MKISRIRAAPDARAGRAVRAVVFRYELPFKYCAAGDTGRVRVGDARHAELVPPRRASRLLRAYQRGRNPYRPPSWVCTTSVLPASTGAAVIALPSVFIRAMKLPSSRDRKCTKPL